MPTADAAAFVAGIRRYPVKSMGGESLNEVGIDRRGVEGDRLYAVRDADNRLASGKNTRRFRRRDQVFDYSARTSGSDVVVLREGRQWRAGEPDLDADLTAAMDAEVHLAVEDDLPHQDRGAVSLIGQATLSWCEERWSLDADPRRLRMNFLVASPEPFVEESWVGADLVIGTARLRVVERAPRCRMIDVAQDGASVQGAWLGPLTASRGMYLGVYAEVVTPGLVEVGATVTAH